MHRPALTEQVQLVGRLERELAAARKKTAAKIRKVREDCGLSLSQIQPFVGLSRAGISNLERGVTWETTTAERVARVLDDRCGSAA